MHSPGPRLTSRRAFLRGAFAMSAIGVASSAALAGCNLFSSAGPQAESTPALEGMLTNTVALGHRYDEAISGVPDLASTLTPLRDTHRTHAQALAAAIGRPVPSAPADSGAAPTERRTALAALASAEKAGQSEAVTACLAATPRLAPLLGSIAAARASHQEVLA